MKPHTLLTLALALFISACNISLAADVTPPPGYEPSPVRVTETATQAGPLYPLVPPNSRDGQPVYEEKCAPCHGTSGLGDGPRAAQLPNPTPPIGSIDIARNASPAKWYQVVTQGNMEKFMPPFASLPDRQRWDVVAYVFSLSTPGASIEQGALIYQEKCASCHGEQGRGDGPAARGLSRPPRNLTEQAYMAEKSAADLAQIVRTGIAPAMPAFDGQLSDADVWSVGDYLRSLTFRFTEQQPTPSSSDLSPTPIVSPTTPITSSQAITQVYGIITGTVVNASGGAVPVGLNITLHSFDSMQVVYTQTTQLGPDGKYIFDQVEIPAGRNYLVTVEYIDVTYGSDIVVAEKDGDSLFMPVSIYDKTNDPSDISADRLHIFFEFKDPQTMRVTELYILSNNGTRTLTPNGDQPSLTFKVPEGATNLRFDDQGMGGGQLVEVPGGAGDMSPVRPGQGSHQALFGFEMPFNRKLEIAQPVSLPIGAIVILVPQSAIQVKGEQIQDVGTRDVQGVNYRMYNGGNLAAGDVLKLTVTGAPQDNTATLPTGSRNSLLIGLGALGIVLIFGGLWLYRRNAEKLAVDGAPAGADISLANPAGKNHPGDNAEAIMDAILTLDDLYKSGEIPEEAYQQRRAELKTRLKGIL